MGAGVKQVARKRAVRPLQMQFRLAPARETLAPIRPAETGERGTIEERFRAFHQRNPQVFEVLKARALEMRRRGVTKYGIAGLFELLRWQYAMQTQGGAYRLNNDFRAPYARKLMDEVPGLAGFFEVRWRREERG